MSTITRPLYVVWEITQFCNLRCAHCYSNAATPLPDELSLDESKRLIDQLRDAGTIVLALSGGEPLMRHDWQEIVEYATAAGLLVSIGTNGAPVTETIADRIRDLGIESVCVSLDGVTAVTHNSMRGHRKSFEWAIAAIERLRRRDIRTIVGFTPTTLNLSDAYEIIEFARSLGASGVNLSEYVPTGRGDLELAPRRDELRKIIDFWARKQRENQDRNFSIYWHDCRVGEFLAADERAKYSGCGAGRVLCRVTYNGGVAPCVTLPVIAGSLREKSFKEIWTESELLRGLRDRKSITGTNCSQCSSLETCGGCRAAAFACTGDVFGEDPYCWISPPSDMKPLPLLTTR